MKIKLFEVRLKKEYLRQDQNLLNNFLENITVKKTETHLVEEKESYWSVAIFYEEKEGAVENPTRKNSVKETVLTDEENRILTSLKVWRTDKAKELGVAPFVVSHNAQLFAVAKSKPKAISDLFSIRGFGEKNVAKYGEDIIALMNSL